ncbi:uncharacterized protein [Antedon mediterranea]|uniref:uncharacterized protein n=1 Tax=Antedon mediterranea TaxID=105859 RepID=UPI003AF60705
MYHHTPLVDKDKENKLSQRHIKSVTRCKTPHRKPLSLVNSSTSLLSLTPATTLSRKKPSTTDHQESFSPTCFTPVRPLKKQLKRSKTPCILRDESVEKPKISQGDASPCKVNIREEKLQITPDCSILLKHNGVSPPIDDDAITEFVNSIIEKQLAILQDDNAKYSTKGSQELKETSSAQSAETEPSQILKPLEDAVTTSPQNDGDQCHIEIKESLASYSPFQSTSVNLFNVCDSASHASPEWHVDNFDLITTRDTASTDCLHSFHSSFSPVKMIDSFSSPKDCLFNSPKNLLKHVDTTNSAVNTTPARSIHVFTSMTPVPSKDEGTTATPYQKIVSDSSTSITPKHLKDGISQMTPRSWQEQGTFPVVMVDEAVNMTPPPVKSTATQFTPRSFKDQSTSVTPHQTSDATSCTSPLANIDLNFTQEESQNDSELHNQLESTAICNEILRQDIQTLESKVNSMKNHGKEKDQEVIQMSRELVEQEEHFKSLHKKAIEELEIQVGEQTKQIVSLEQTLIQKCDETNILEADLSCTKSHYQKQIQNLQQDLCRAYRQHKKEVERMRDDVKENGNLKEKLKAATDRVKELEESLKSFSRFEDALQEEDEVQEEMESLNDYYASLEVLVRQMEEECKKYKEENLLMKVKMEENDARVGNAFEEVNEANEYINELRMELELTKAERSQLDELYKKASLELGVATHQYTEFLTCFEQTKMELDQCKDSVSYLQEQNTLYDQKAIESCLNEMSLEASLIVQTDQTYRQQTHNEAVIAELGAANDELNKKCSELQSAYKDEIQSLHSKIEELLQENTENKRRIADQFQEIRMNFQVKAQLYQAKQSIQKMEENYKESHDFVKTECQALNETLTEKESECQALIQDLSRYKMTLYSKLEEMDELQEATSMLRQQLMDCESELDNTKANAHLMLLNQLSEMADASKEIDSLQSLMVTAINSLEMPQQCEQKSDVLSVKGQRLEKQLGEIKYSETVEDSVNASSHSEVSLVASILQAINGGDHTQEMSYRYDTDDQPDTTYRYDTTDVEPDTGCQKSPVLGSESSAFTAVKPQRIQNTDTTVNESDDGQSDSQKKSLGDSVRATCSLFQKLVSSMKENEMELMNKNEELIQERQMIEDRLKKTINYFDIENGQFRERLQESECRERRLHQTLKSRMSELAEQNMIIGYKQQQLNTMATKLDGFSDLQIENKHLKEEIGTLQNLIKGSNMQQQLLEKELTEMTRRLDCVEGELDAKKIIQDNISLKKEMEKLKLHAMAKNDYYEKLNSKASRQMKTLKDNWKKAEEEIVQLDTMLDLCKKHVTNIPASFATHRSIQGLHELFKD